MRPCGLELHCHDHQIGDALPGGGSRAEAMGFARSFRLLAILLDHLIKHYPCRQASGIDSDTVKFAIETNRAGNLLAAIARPPAEIEATIPVGPPSCAGRFLKPPGIS